MYSSDYTVVIILLDPRTFQQILVSFILWPSGNIDGVSIGRGNDLLPAGTKLLPEMMLTYHQ